MTRVKAEGARPERTGEELWRWEMLHAMKAQRPEMTMPELSDATRILSNKEGLTIDRVKGIFNKSLSPSLDEIGLIADVLGVPRQTACQYLGLIEDAASYEASRLLLEAIDRRIQQEKEAGGWEVGQIAAALSRSTRWAMSAFPVMNGPSEDTLIHAVDRIQIVPADPSDINDKEIADRILEDDDVRQVFQHLHLDRIRYDGQSDFPISDDYKLLALETPVKTRKEENESPRVWCSLLALALQPGEETAWERTATQMRSAVGRSRRSPSEEGLPRRSQGTWG